MSAMKWWGWGAPDKRLEIGAEAQAMLREELGDGQPAERAELDQVTMPAARPLPDALARAVDAEGFATGHADRVLHAGGKGYPDLIRARAG